MNFLFSIRNPDSGDHVVCAADPGGDLVIPFNHRARLSRYRITVGDRVPQICGAAPAQLETEVARKIEDSGF